MLCVVMILSYCIQQPSCEFRRTYPPRISISCLLISTAIPLYSRYHISSIDSSLCLSWHGNLNNPKSRLYLFIGIAWFIMSVILLGLSCQEYFCCAIILWDLNTMLVKNNPFNSFVEHLFFFLTYSGRLVLRGLYLVEGL